jgi:tRNA (cytidine/uridine-2'-O-)-methyltransferase
MWLCMVGPPIAPGGHGLSRGGDIESARILDVVSNRRTASGPPRLVNTHGETPYAEFRFRTSDTLVVGRESAGVPAEVHDVADARLVIPMVAGARSLNVAMAASIVLSEALRQTAALPQSLVNAS